MRILSDGEEVVESLMDLKDCWVAVRDWRGFRHLNKLKLVKSVTEGNFDARVFEVSSELP